MMNWLSVIGIFVLGVSPGVYVNQQLDASIPIVPEAIVTEAVESPSEYDDFAQCLTNTGVVKYGSDLCSHCINQKALFGSSFQYVNYVECNEQPEKCQDADITGYPTWVYPDADGSEKSRVSGVQTLMQLSEESGCPMFQ